MNEVSSDWYYEFEDEFEDDVEEEVEEEYDDPYENEPFILDIQENL